MEGSGQAYETLIGQVMQLFPEVARQVRAEVSRGIDIPGEEPNSGWYSKPKPKPTEITTRKYSDDERLEILLAALATIARTAIESRQAIAKLLGAAVGQGEENYRITFVDTDTDENIMTMSMAQILQTEEIESVLRGLEQALELVRQG